MTVTGRGQGTVLVPAGHLRQPPQLCQAPCVSPRISRATSAACPRAPCSPTLLRAMAPSSVPCGAGWQGGRGQQSPAFGNLQYLFFLSSLWSWGTQVFRESRGCCVWVDQGETRGPDPRAGWPRACTSSKCSPSCPVPNQLLGDPEWLFSGFCFFGSCVFVFLAPLSLAAARLQCLPSSALLRSPPPTPCSLVPER